MEQSSFILTSSGFFDPSGNLIKSIGTGYHDHNTGCPMDSEKSKTREEKPKERTETREERHRRREERRRREKRREL